jgi:mannobiose 2-epimerase
MRAADALGTPRGAINGWAKAMVDLSMRFGYDREHGGFYNSGPLGVESDDRRKVWWVQSEALVAMLEMYRLSGEQEYFEAFERTLEFCNKYHVAHRQGGWWASRNADGTADANRSRTSQWQAGYHNGRALLYASRLLDALADRETVSRQN